MVSDAQLQPLLGHQFVEQKVGEDHLLAGEIGATLWAPLGRLDAAHDALVAVRVTTFGDVCLGDQLEADRTEEVGILRVHR